MCDSSFVGGFKNLVFVPPTDMFAKLGILNLSRYESRRPLRFYQLLKVFKRALLEWNGVKCSGEWSLISCKEWN